MESMRTLRTRDQLAQWKYGVKTDYSDHKDRVEDAGNLLVALLARQRSWATEALFDILYGESDPALQSLSSKSLHTGLQRMYFERGRWKSGPVLSMAWQCIQAGRFDVLRELVKRGPPPNYPETTATPGATTESGRWLDALTSRVGEASCFPRCLFWTGIKDGGAHLAALLADVDPQHAGTDCLAGKESGAAFFELVMKQAVAEAVAVAPADQICSAPRRRMAL